MKAFLRGHTRLLFTAFLLLHLLPLWYFRYFPSQDGPMHLYNAIVLNDYSSHENYQIRSGYDLNLSVFPNWMYFLLILPLLSIFPPLVAEKLVLSLCVAGLPVSFLYFHRSVNRKAGVFVLLGFLYSYSYLLMMGFYNFVFGCSVYFLALGFWYRRRDQMTVAGAVWLYVLLILLYLCHGVPLAVFLVSVSILTLARAVRKILASRGGPGFSGALRLQIRHVLSVAALVSPAGFILFMETLKRAQAPWYRGFAYLMNSLAEFQPLVYFTRDHHLWMVLLWILIALAAVLTMRELLRRQVPAEDSVDFAFLWLALLFLYFMLPWGYGPGGWVGGGWVNDRVQFLLIPAASPFLYVENKHRIRKALGFLLVLICFVHLGFTIRDMRKINLELSDMVSVCEGVSPHSTISSTIQWDPFKMGNNLSPYLFPAAYCILSAKDMLYLSNYEAQLDYFPVNFSKTGSITPDYHLISGSPESLEKEYAVTRQASRVALLKSRALQRRPDDLQEQGIDFGAPQSMTAAGYIGMDVNALWTPGGAGWLRAPVKGSFARGVSGAENETGKLLGDYVGSHRDGVFVLSLPNDRYHVTLYFFSGDSGSHKIGLIANDQQVLRGLSIPAGQFASQEYEITITDEKLVQVMYSAQKQSPDGRLHGHWVWSGFSIYRLHSRS